jgi:Tol biopolymer transport system component/DNA-binding winged helix-turn-helix (wHTH) protein
MRPAEMKENPRRYHFDGFTLDLDLHALFRGEERIHLTSKPLETLIHLVEHRGRTVEKQSLLDAVWKDVAVTEDTLVHAVREIRRVLEDDKDNPRFVQTVPREGYRFVGAVSAELPFAEPKATNASHLHVAAPKRTGLPLVWLIPGLIVLAVSLTASLIWFVRQGRESQLARAAPQPRQMRQLSSGVVSAVKPAFSPDGKFLLYLADQAGAPRMLDVFVMPAAGGNAMPITDRFGASGDLPAFTADSSQVVLSRYRNGEDGSRLPDLWKVPILGGLPRCFITEASGAGFSPDGKWVAYTKHLPDRRALWISPMERLDEHREVSEMGFTPRWSPDGEWIAYTTSSIEGWGGELWAVPASLAKPRQLTQERQAIYGLTWTADSRSLIFAARRNGVFHLYQVSLTDGSIEPLTNGVGDYVTPSVSPNGKTLIFVHANHARDLVTAAGAEDPEVETLTQAEYHLWPRLSPSGRRVASVTRRSDFGEHLYVTDLKTRKSTRLSDRPARHPCWLDEDHLSYLSRPANSEATEVRIVNLTTDHDSLWTRFPGGANWLAVHPDSKRLAVVLKWPVGRPQVVLRDTEKNTDLTLAEGEEYTELRWSPGGSALSWSGPEVSADAASNGVWMVEPGRGKPRQLVKDGYGPVWSADGASVWFSRFPTMGDHSGLWRLDVRRNTAVKIRSWKAVAYYDLVGERLVYAQDSNRGQIYSMPLNQ